MNEEKAAPVLAQKAYESGLRLDEFVSKLGGSLQVYANISLVGVVYDYRRILAEGISVPGRGPVNSFLSFVAARDGDTEFAARLLSEAIASAFYRYGEPVSSQDDVIEAFFQHGIRGLNPPQWVKAWRYGNLPEEGRSYNFRERFREPGVSVAGVIGGASGFGFWQKDRPVRWLEGWLREDVTGSDGEPLLVGAVNSRKPRGFVIPEPDL